MNAPQPSASVPAGPVQEQVILPWKIAIRITLRGLRIRLGRSLITLSGVVLGIAFLMSVLTGEGLRTGLAAETRAKTEVTRLVKLVEEEIGTFQQRKIALLVSGPLTDKHRLRMLQKVASRADTGAIWVYHTRPDALTPAAGPLPAEFQGPAFTPATDFAACVQDAHLLLLLDEALPAIAPETLVDYLGRMLQPVVLDACHGRYDEAGLRRLNETVIYANLSYQMTDEEVARVQRRAVQDRARRVWIIVVSMLVTVIGIANAMLMSVTERIREIGTMKCLGALSEFVVKLFLIESFLIGALGAVIGTFLGFLVTFFGHWLGTETLLLLASTPFGQLLVFGVESMLAGTVLAILAAIYPARVAAKMVPADALRTNV